MLTHFRGMMIIARPIIVRTSRCKSMSVQGECNTSMHAGHSLLGRLLFIIAGEAIGNAPQLRAKTHIHTYAHTQFLNRHSSTCSASQIRNTATLPAALTIYSPSACIGAGLSPSINPAHIVQRAEASLHLRRVPWFRTTLRPRLCSECSCRLLQCPAGRDRRGSSETSVIDCFY